MIGLTWALEGLSRAMAQFNGAAAKVAQAPLSADPSADSVDLSAEAIAMLEARNSFSASTKIIQTADAMEKSLLDIMA